MEHADWVTPLLRGIAGLFALQLLWIAAWLQFRQPAPSHDAHDIGLD